METVIKHKFALDSVIRNRVFEAKVMAVTIDFAGNVSYVLSQSTHDGIRRHTVAEWELDAFTVKDA